MSKLSKKVVLLSNLILLTFSSICLSQTITAEYLDPNNDDGDPYKYVRFGNSSQYWGGLMWNNTNPVYGNGDDFSIFTYNNRDLTFRTGSGHIILHPSGNGNVGIGTSNPEAMLQVEEEVWVGGKHYNSGTDYGVGKVTMGMDYWGGGYIQLAGDNNTNHGPSQPQTQTMWIHAKGNGSYMGISSPTVSDFFVAHRNGRVGIGTTSPNYKLDVNGNVRAEEIVVIEDVGADFVFEESYNLPGLSEVERHIKTHKHLPKIPTAEQMKRDGVKVGELQIKLLQKIEELTLHTIKQQKMIQEQQNENLGLKRRLESIEQKINTDESIPKSMVPMYTFSGGVLPDGLIVDENGNVGIGRTNPGYKLDVNGNARFSGYVHFSKGLAIEKVSKRMEYDPLIYDASTLGNGTYKIIIQGSNMGVDHKSSLYAEYIYQDLHDADPQLYQAIYLRNWSSGGLGQVSHSGTTIAVNWSGSRSAQISVVEIQKDW